MGGGYEPEKAAPPVIPPVEEKKGEAAAPVASAPEERKKRSKALIFAIIALIVILLLLLFRTCSNDEDTRNAEAAAGIAAIAEEGPASSTSIPGSAMEDEESAAVEECDADGEPSITADEASSEAPAEVTASSTTSTSEEATTTSSGTPAGEGSESSDTATSYKAEDEIRESLMLAGIAVSIDSNGSSTLISYPGSISDEEVRAFLDGEMERYGLSESGVGYELTEEGILITYPEGTDLETREDAIRVLSSDLSEYILSSDEEDAEEEEVMDLPLVAVITAGGITSDVESYKHHTTFTIPEGVSAEDASAFFDYEIERYGYEGAVSYEIEDGVLTLGYPGPQDEEFREEAIRQIGIDLHYYLMGEEKPEDEEELQNIYNTINNVTVISREDDAVEEEEEPWKEIGHSLHVFASPYSYSFVDFYNGRDAISGAGIPLSEFGSSYGFSAMLSYDYRITDFLSVGIEAGINEYWTTRSTLQEGTRYHQIPVLANALFHVGGERIGFFAGVNAGVDISSLTSTDGLYFMGGIELGLTWRFAEHWSLFWKAMGEMTVQTHPAERLLDSITYAVQPAFIGISYHI